MLPINASLEKVSPSRHRPIGGGPEFCELPPDCSSSSLPHARGGVIISLEILLWKTCFRESHCHWLWLTGSRACPSRSAGLGLRGVEQRTLHLSLMWAADSLVHPKAGDQLSTLSPGGYLSGDTPGHHFAGWIVHVPLTSWGQNVGLDTLREGHELNITATFACRERLEQLSSVRSPTPSSVWFGVGSAIKSSWRNCHDYVITSKGTNDLSCSAHNQLQHGEKCCQLAWPGSLLPELKPAFPAMLGSFSAPSQPPKPGSHTWQVLCTCLSHFLAGAAGTCPAALQVEC